MGGHRRETGERFLDDTHLYARDLDMFGRGSLFELLSSARTRIGEETLAAWLKAPADPAAVRARQDAVRELAPRTDLREDLAVIGEDARKGCTPKRSRRGANGRQDSGRPRSPRGSG